jgi:hypothetical protein
VISRLVIDAEAMRYEPTYCPSTRHACPPESEAFTDAIHLDDLFECKSSEEERVVYKKLNSTETLIQRTTMDVPQQTYVLHRARRSQEDDQLLR